MSSTTSFYGTSTSSLNRTGLLKELGESYGIYFNDPDEEEEIKNTDNEYELIKKPWYKRIFKSNTIDFTKRGK